MARPVLLVTFSVPNRADHFADEALWIFVSQLNPAGEIPVVRSKRIGQFLEGSSRTINTHHDLRNPRNSGAECRPDRAINKFRRAACLLRPVSDLEPCCLRQPRRLLF